MGAESSRIVVRRPAGGYRDAVRGYAIEVDGERAGMVRAGGELVLDLRPGLHVVRATIDWSGSKPLEVDLGPGTVTDLVVAPAGSAVKVWQAFTLSGYLTLRLDEGRGQESGHEH